MEEIRTSRCSAGIELFGSEGSAFASIGANGAGKTTTIKVLMNIIEPSRGSATMMGVDSRKISPRQLSQIGYVSENQEQGARASILGQLRLPPKRRIGDLSHGMRMKMSLACALPFRPKLLILDEPFSGLDSLGARRIHGRTASAGGEMTVLISSHDRLRYGE